MDEKQERIRRERRRKHVKFYVPPERVAHFPNTKTVYKVVEECEGEFGIYQSTFEVRHIMEYTVGRITQASTGYGMSVLEDLRKVLKMLEGLKWNTDKLVLGQFTAYYDQYLPREYSEQSTWDSIVAQALRFDHELCTYNELKKIGVIEMLRRCRNG